MIRTGTLTTLLLLTTAAQAQINIPGIKTPEIKLPSLDSLLKGEAPLSTTIKDAKIWGWPQFKRLNPSQPTTLTSTDRNKEHLFTLKPGHYEFTIKSFCGKGYTYGPTKGMGYIEGPWKGSRHKFLFDLLHRYNAKSEVPQQDVQLLIWAVLAKVKPQDMHPKAQSALLALMGKDGQKLLADGALDYFTGKAADQLFAKASAELRPLLEYDNKIRGLQRDANATFDQFERLAVLEAPADSRSEVPEKTWNLSPRGYLIRYKPSGYSRTEVEVIIPRRATFQRDAQKRIQAVTWPDGHKIQISYADSPAASIANDSGIKAHAVTKVEISHPAWSSPLVATKPDVLLQGIPAKKRSANAPTQTISLLTLFPRQDWMGRYEDARDLHDRIETYQEWYERTQRIERGDEPSEDLFNSDHISDLIDSIFGGTDDRLEQIADTHGRLAEHLAHATNVLDGLPTESTVDPGDRIITPAAGGHQLLLGSTNTF
jgi:hypothetical protein